MSPIVAPVRDSSEIEPFVAAHAREPDGGLIVMPDVFLLARRAAVTRYILRGPLSWKKARRTIHDQLLRALEKHLPYAIGALEGSFELILGEFARQVLKAYRCSKRAIF
jgi:hypothetical protein